ncbi:MAG: PQQ-binding-like beta-propeller repeat protein [Candidatus Bathyarchaeia archaeon]|jgi:outer membrane protein assembly factor BamB
MKKHKFKFAKETRNYAKLTTISLILLLTATMIIAIVPTVRADDIETFALISVSPNPIGVEQRAFVNFWLSNPPLYAAVTNDIRWQGFTLTITKPDGTNQTMGPYESDSAGMAYVTYTPDKVGTYYFQFSFAGQNHTGNYYKPSTSQRVELTVQEEPIAMWQGSALPIDYWQRPIEAENREWSSISGNWLMSTYNTTGPYNPYTNAPNTAHIVWTKQGEIGGIAGGEYGSTSYSTEYYFNSFYPPIILNGRLYYNEMTSPRYGFYCVDLRTGEQLWWHNSTAPAAQQKIANWIGCEYYPGIDMGQILNFETPNQAGTYAYLWSLGSQYSMYDAFTGNWICDFDNVSAGTPTLDSNGNLITYILDGKNNWLAMWNSTKCILKQQSLTSWIFQNAPGDLTMPEDVWIWSPPVGETLDWRKGIEWNVTVPNVEYAPSGLVQSISKIGSDVILATVQSQRARLAETMGWQLEIGYDANTGDVLWGPINRTCVEGSNMLDFQGPMGEGVFTEYHRDTKEWYGYDVYTGKQLWGPTEPTESDWGTFTAGYVIADGKFYTAGYDGMVYAYDIKTGDLSWEWYVGSSGFETGLGTWALQGGITDADGKIYVRTGQHSPTQPLERGDRLFCLNTTTGEELWNISGCMQQPAPIADGYLVTWNYYDGQIYCFGKGQTATTVSASPDVSVHGNSILIKGTVLDQSPGETCLGIPAKGTPAISDDSMSEWMEYLYMQKPQPTNATGVQVTLSVVDSNGNYREIGRTTSDANGFYSYNWTPDIEGKYTLYASFAGSESYWPSHAVTAFNVSPAPATVQPTATPQSVADTYFIPATIGIILAIIIVGLTTLLVLRKRP